MNGSDHPTVGPQVRWYYHDWIGFLFGAEAESTHVATDAFVRPARAKPGGTKIRGPRPHISAGCTARLSYGGPTRI
jgi:hypothetical protein